MSQPANSARVVGIFQVIISAICFGFLGLFGKQAFAKGLNPFELLGSRFLLSGLLMSVMILLFTKRWRQFSFKQIVVCALLGACGYAVFSGLYFLSVRGLSMSLAVLLLYTFPLMVALGGWIFLKEPLPKSKLLAVPLCFCGTVLLIWGDFKVESLISIFFGLGAAISYAIYILGSSRWLKSVDALVASAIIQLAAGALLFTIGFHSPERSIEVFAIGYPQIIGLAIVCSVLPITLFQLGLQKIQGWEASVISTIEPITAILLSMLILNEPFSNLQIIGSLVVLIALVWVTLPSPFLNRT